MKEQQYVECGRNVISVSVGRIALDERSGLELSSGIFASMLYSIEGASEGNRAIVLELVAPLEH